MDMSVKPNAGQGQEQLVGQGSICKAGPGGNRESVMGKKPFVERAVAGKAARSNGLSNQVPLARAAGDLIKVKKEWAISSCPGIGLLGVTVNRPASECRGDRGEAKL